MKNFFLAGLCLFSISSLLPSGCTMTDETESQSAITQQNAKLQQENSQLTEELSSRKEQTANLKLKLLEKDAEINKLKKMQQGLGKEVARRKTKMRVPESKAEAVAVLAEIETDINTARERITNDGQRQVFVKADRLMTESKTQLDQAHYDRACSLAGDALELIQTLELKTAEPARKGPVIPFAFPLKMQVTKKSNVRTLPNGAAPVVQVLDQGKMVTATGYENHWIKITLDSKEVGWIHYSLLSLPKI